MIIAVINNKGGTGKTTTAVNLGGAFAKLGYNALVVDLDPQASASLFLGTNSNESSPSMSKVLFNDVSIKSAVRSSSMPGLDFMTADPELYNADLIWSDVSGRERKLTTALESIKVDYDFILCDCPPSFSTISVNALVAADAYIIPVTPDYLVLEDLSCMIGLVEELRDNMPIEVELLGIVLTMTPTTSPLLSSKARLARSNIDILRKHFDENVVSTEIKMNTKLAEAPAHGTTVFGSARSSQAAKQYLKLAEELIQRCGMLTLKATSRRTAKLKGQERNELGAST